MSKNPIVNLLNNQERFEQVTKAVFDSVDTDGSGQVDRNELKNAMVNIANESKVALPTEEEITKLITALDTDGNGTLSVSEFSVLLRKVLQALAALMPVEEEEEVKVE